VTKSQQQVSAFAFGIVFIITMLTLAITVPEPTAFQYTVFRIVLALATAGIAAMIPGFLHVETPGWMRAGGALAVFVLVYFYNPASLVHPDSSQTKPIGPTPTNRAATVHVSSTNNTTNSMSTETASPGSNVSSLKNHVPQSSAPTVGTDVSALQRQASDDIAYRQDLTGIGPNSFISQGCTWTQLRGSVKVADAETLVWFEWGETPELGMVTPKQRFSKDTIFYQDLINLKENTKYWYRTYSSSANGTTEGRVYSFTTRRCEVSSSSDGASKARPNSR
jgi:hypothetical protein